MTVRSLVKRLLFGAWTNLFGDKNRRVFVTTLTGPARGLRFRLDLLGNYETRYLLGNYELSVTSRLSELVRPGWTVWDIGTYVGYYTCLFARLVGRGGNVVAVEADPRNISRTQENATLNGFENTTFVQSAIGVPNAEVELFLSQGTNTHLAGAWIGAKKEEYQPTEARAQTVKVRCLSCDQLITTKGVPRPDLIKFDIDGAEIWAFKYMEVIPKLVRPLLLVELHNPECDKAAWNFAVRWGYRIQNFETGEIFNAAEAVNGTVLLTPIAPPI